MKSRLLIVIGIILIFVGILLSMLIFTYDMSMSGYSIQRTESSIIIGPIDDKQFKRLILDDYAGQQGFFTDENFIEYFSVNENEQYLQRVQFLSKVNSYTINYECISIDGAFRNIFTENLEFDKLKEYVADNFCYNFKHANNNTESSIWPSSKMLSWCADKFDQTKHEFYQSLEGYTCDNPICPESEPPLFSSALHSDEEFIENGCAKFVDKWAYLTEDNDYTWDYVHWESFVKHHYESDPISDPQRNEKCADLFDLIMRSAEYSDLWYELTETNDFRDAKCASIVGEWDQLTEHNVWNIGISWKNVAENALYGCDQNEVYYSGVCMTLETKERAQSIGEIDVEPERLSQVLRLCENTDAQYLGALSFENSTHHIDSQTCTWRLLDEN